MTALFIHLYRRVMKRSRVLSLTALASVPALVIWLVGLDQSAQEMETIYSGILSFVGTTYAIAVLIVAAAVLREERDGGTLPYIYMRPMSRVSIAMAAVAAGIAAGLTIGLGGWLASLLAALAVGVELSVPLAATTLFLAAGVGYGAIFVPLGYLVPRALLVGLGYILVVESIVAAAVTGLAQFSIWRISLSIYGEFAPSVGEGFEAVLGPVSVGAIGGSVKLLVVLILGVGLLTWALRRRDAL